MRYLPFLLFSISSISTIWAAELPKLNQSLGAAQAKTDGDMLTVSTGAMTRQWKWTGKGLLTHSLAAPDDKVLAAGTEETADWHLGEPGEGKLVSLKAFADDDDRFTSKHLAIEAEIQYPTLHLKYVIWAYPGAPGLRTQLWLKSPGKVSSLGRGISESLTLQTDPESIFTWSYRAGLKANMHPYEILETKKLEDKNWHKKTSGLMADLGGHGIILIKESHAHSHIPDDGCAVGGFGRDGRALRVDGLGMRPNDVSSDYKFCWANWIIHYEGNDVDAQLALKQFDRFRYPVHPDRDIFIMANTWGSEDKRPPCLYKAREENVLREIDACANLGVDLLQIDDGWQNDNWLPAATWTTQNRHEKPGEMQNGTMVPSQYDIYPEGFANVRDAAKTAEIKLGLWHSWKAPLESIVANMENGDFKAFKLDFAILGKKNDLDYLYYKARKLVKHSEYTAVVNWDVTEHPPRIGFYFGRDCGNLYLVNRKAATVRTPVLYNPWQILRDAWLLARYANLNKIQLTFQNKDHVSDKAKTSARDYPHDYNFAITLMSSPILFLETQLLSDDAVDTLKPIIAKYKSERLEMYKGFVFPIGKKPDNASWTGLQNHNFNAGTGYLTVYRELMNKEPAAKLALHFLESGTKLKLTDVLTGENRTVRLNDKAELEFNIPKAPGFLFLKYE